jgi:hypothetical protein
VRIISATGIANRTVKKMVAGPRRPMAGRADRAKARQVARLEARGPAGPDGTIAASTVEIIDEVWVVSMDPCVLGAQYVDNNHHNLSIIKPIL